MASAPVAHALPGVSSGERWSVAAVAQALRPLPAGVHALRYAATRFSTRGLDTADRM